MAKSKANKNEQPAAEISATKFDGDSFVITGIGASAGGIQAFQDFFQNGSDFSIVFNDENSCHSELDQWMNIRVAAHCVSCKGMV